jgi:hypothetical protein
MTNRKIKRVGAALWRAGLLAGLAASLSSCFMFSRTGKPVVPEDEARHRAALTNLIVVNRTGTQLIIAFRAATPPEQEVVIGTVLAGARATVAPIPAGEPIVLIARTPDGGQFTLTAHSYPIDQDFMWDIPAETVFRKSADHG